jgi:hypothetical protein
VGPPGTNNVIEYHHNVVAKDHELLAIALPIKKVAGKESAPQKPRMLIMRGFLGVGNKVLTIVVSDLVVDVVFFAVQLMLLSLGYITAVDPCIALLLTVHAGVFMLQLSVVTT